ncbi:MAG: hypothetical protein JXR25_11055 [Pontiellaceae bacterium]|nr:hypothetical protein [Pontiellaceae bacterium]
MKRIVHILPLLVCVGGIGIIVVAIKESREEQQKAAFVEKAVPQEAAAPDAKTYAPQDRKLVQQVFDNPQMMDDASPQAAAISSSVERPGNPSTLSSSMNNASMHMERPSETITVPPKNLESFASLRTDAVRNPESQQNQATAEEIMKMRQRRVERLATLGEQ